VSRRRAGRVRFHRWGSRQSVRRRFATRGVFRRLKGMVRWVDCGCKWFGGGSSSLLLCNYSRKCQCGASVSIGFLAILEAWVGSPFRVREPRPESDLVVF